MNPVPPTHPKQAERLVSLDALDRLIRDGDARLQALVELAAQLCDSPISVVSLVNVDQQYFVARTGLAAASTPAEHAFCAHAILEEGVFEVTDATIDPRFAANPLVTGAPDIRHYAGVPLLDSHALPLGTLCVIDRRPRALTEEQNRILRVLADQASHVIRSRRMVESLRDLAAGGQEALLDAELLRRLAHDIRVPLSGILGLSELLSSREVDETFATDVAHLQAAARHLGALLDDLLLMGRAGAPASRVQVEVDIEWLLRESLTLATGRATPQTKCRLVVDEGIPNRLSLHADATRRVLCNLIDNACKFTKSGEVLVEASWREGLLAITVRDTGSGMEPSTLHSAFDAYVRGTTGGSGLGLAIVRELVEKMGGRVWAESALGSGTSVFLEIPSRPWTPTDPVHSLRVFVAEDDATNRLVLTRYLETIGATPTAFPDGVELLAAMAEGECDVVIVDYWMPGLTGPDVVARLRRDHGDAIKAYGWSGEADGDVSARFLAAGADGVLPKPLSLEVLRETLERR